MKPVLILEKALLETEDFHFLNRAASLIEEGCDARGYDDVQRRVQENFPTFRTHLANATTTDSMYDPEKFGSYHSTDAHIGPAATVAFSLHSWAKNSRRVFSLDGDLQLLLDATSLEGITLEDIQFPFDSFLVEIPHPFVGMDRQSFRYGLFTIIRDPSKGIAVKWCMFSDNQLNYQPLTLPERNGLTAAIKRKRWNTAARMQERLTKGLSQQKYWPGGMNWMKSGKPLDAIIDGLKGEGYAFDSAWLRVTFGLCLYLKSLPTRSPLVSEWERTERVPSPRGNAVSTDAQVCSVASSFTLSAEERVAFSDPKGEPTRSFGEKCCHFRRGFWCRPKNSGPQARRTEWRRPTIVRRDKMVPGQLPRGAENMIRLTASSEKHRPPVPSEE